MKQWPEGNKTIYFEDLIDSIKACLKYHYIMIRKETPNSMIYNGYDIGSSTKATSLSPDRALSVDNLRYSLEEQGKDALEVIIGIAVQLGIEQGIRIEKENSRYLQLLVDMVINKPGGDIDKNYWMAITKLPEDEPEDE